MKVTDVMTQILRDRGVRQVFELCGGMITHLLDSLYHEDEISVVSVHHEQAAAFAAEAVGRMTGVPGVAIATSGPGATNLLTAIGSCYFDSSPAVFITGQVNRNELKQSRPIRQLGFQECDIISIAKTITKAAWQINSPEEVPAKLIEAFRLAAEGRPGPVLLDIPMDVQRADIDWRSAAGEGQSAKQPALDEVKEFVDAIAVAKQPMILAGGGLRSARAVDSFRAFVKAVHVPVVYSLMALDVLPFDDPLRVGMIGTYGNRWANLSMAQSDLLLVLGSRLDIRQTGADVDAFKNGRRIIHVDVDKGEMNNRVTGCTAIEAHLQPFLQEALTALRGKKIASRPDWIAKINELKRRWPDTEELSVTEGIHPNRFMHRLSARFANAAAYVIDVGAHQMWSGQSLEPGINQRVLTSGGMGAMGFALPAGIGVAYTTKQPVVVISGDGGFQTNLQELEVIARNRLPLKMVVINNRSLGMVRQFQQSYFDSRFQSTVWGYGAPDFVRVAEGFGIAGLAAKEESEVDAALDWLHHDPAAPALLEVFISPEANAYPKIAFGSPFTVMEP